MNKILFVLSVICLSCADNSISNVTTQQNLKDCGEQVTECSCEEFSEDDYLGRTKDSNSCISQQVSITTCSMSCTNNKPMWSSICFCE